MDGGLIQRGRRERWVVGLKKLFLISRINDSTVSQLVQITEIVFSSVGNLHDEFLRITERRKISKPEEEDRV